MTSKRATDPPPARDKDTGPALVPELPVDEHEEQLIDQALTETFPASDPIAVPAPKDKRRRH